MAKDLRGTFTFASSFDSDLSAWDLSRVKRVDELLQSAYQFNNGGGSLSGWDLSRVAHADFVFLSAFAFNQAVSG